MMFLVGKNEKEFTTKGLFSVGGHLLEIRRKLPKAKVQREYGISVKSKFM